jgi:hypothetical protein
MFKQPFKIFVIIFLLAGLNWPAFAQRIEKERSEFKQLLIENPNYFGTFPEFPMKPVKPVQYNTKYEELTCLGFYPEQDLLEAIVDVKLPFGYRGDLCSPGSYEYVRFFADWNGDADFNDAGEDLGISAVNVHDIPDTKQACLTSYKPLSYALPLTLDSLQLKKCSTANLVKVRAILSWDMPPTPGNPDFPVVWGNVVEEWIQIRPFKLFLEDIFSIDKVKAFQIDTSLINLQLPVVKPKPLSTEQLKLIYKDTEVPELRYNFSEINQKAQAIKLNPTLMAQYKLDPKDSKLVGDLTVVLAEQSNTKFEELKCVGLNYDQDQLVASLTVKRSLGYSGNLCTPGSYEYVAFWGYVYDQIEQQCVWRYFGTSRVNVHDISTIPPEGLEYDKCSNPRVLKVRAILSWNTPPPTFNPFYNPTWGNTVDAIIQIKPGDVQPGEQKPFIWSLGNMAVESISGNSFTTLASAIGDGYANGVSVGGGYTAIESPFGGVVKISGTITNAPDISSGAAKLKYKVQYRKLGAINWQGISNPFTIWRRLNGVPVGPMGQAIDGGGYYLYQKDLVSPTIIEVQDDVLAQWHTPVPEGDGLYEIRVLLYQMGAPPQPGVPADHVASEVIRIMIDNTRPDAVISLDAGPCTKFAVGDIITGKFTATDDHIWKYRLIVDPTVLVAPTILPTGETYPLLSVPGKINEPYTLTTTATTTPCGYVIRLRVWDRTIRNNHLIGNHKPATVGLCILAEE